MPQVTLRFQKGITTRRNEDPNRPRSLKNAKLVQFGVVRSLRAPTALFPYWQEEDYATQRNFVFNRPPRWMFDDLADPSVEVLSRVAGAFNRSARWMFDDLADPNIEVLVRQAGSVPADPLLFNIDENDTIIVEIA